MTKSDGEEGMTAKALLPEKNKGNIQNVVNDTSSDLTLNVGDNVTRRVYKIEEIAEIVRPIAENCGAGKIYLFGSYARGEATENSDIDLLIDNGNVHGLGFFGFCGDLERALKTGVDVITVKSLYEEYKNNKYIAKLRAEIERDKVMIYDNQG